MGWDREPQYRSMDAPGVTFFRVLVMLSCLILVPLAAIFGSQFPEVVKTQLVERIQSFVSGFSETATKKEPIRDRSEAAPPYDAAAAAPAYTSPNAPSWNAEPPRYEAVQAGGLPAANANVSAAGAWEAAPVASNEISTPPTVEARAQSPSPPVDTRTTAPVQPQMTPPGHGSNDYFTEIQHRLREYGATHYALETSGPRGELYRFHCSIDGSPTGPGQKFEATDRDPLRAMAQVLEQVEQWRRQPPASETPDAYPTLGSAR